MFKKIALFGFVLSLGACTTVHVHNKGVPPGHAKKGKHHKHNEVKYEIKEKKNGTEIKVKTR